jgi:hypothetical protein
MAASALVWINASHHVGCAIHHRDAAVLEIADQLRELAQF